MRGDLAYRAFLDRPAGSETLAPQFTVSRVA